MKPRFAVLLLLSASVFASALLGASPPIGAQVQAWNYDPKTNLVTLKIVNTSHKEITAFNISIKETYANGRVEEHELLEELVGKILAAKELQGTAQEEVFRKEYGDGAFHPGELRDEKLPVQPGLTDYQAVIDVVTYIDGTADAPINDAALERIVDERRATVASKKMATEIIKTALADANDAEPSVTAARKIQDQATVRRNSHTKMDVDPVILESVARELKTVGNKRDALKQLVDKEEATISILSVHAAVEKNGGPQ